MSKFRKIIIILGVILYSILILQLIVFKYPSGVTFSLASANLMPFETILRYLSGEPTWAVAKRNLLGNIVILMPYGFLLAFLRQKIKLTRVLLFALSTGVILELLQVIFKSGILDIDDIILNFLGVVIGFLFFVFMKYLKSIIKN